MDLQPNKIDGIVKPITNTRISASEWNQLVGSCMAFITAAGFTPDADDNQQFLKAFIQIAQNIGAIGANVDLSNLSATGENHFVQLQSGVAQADVDYVVESYSNGTSWYRVYKSGWCEQGNSTELIPTTGKAVVFLKPFASNDFSAFVCKSTSNYRGAAANPVCTRNNGGLGMNISVGGGANEYAQWYACGYLA